MALLKLFLSSSFRQTSFLCFQESNKMTDNCETMAMSRTTESVNSCYKLLRVICEVFEIKLPIIIYGGVFENFQFVSFIFQKIVVIMEFPTYNVDIRVRACHALICYIRKMKGVPTKSLLYKIEHNIGHLVGEINTENVTYSLYETCDSDSDITLSNINEVDELMKASCYIANFSIEAIEENFIDVLNYKQSFLEGFHINDRIFGCISPNTMNLTERPYQIMLVLCSTETQTNYLWNDEPLPVTLKTSTNSRIRNERLKLWSISQHFSEPSGGVRFGEDIDYKGPYIIIF